MKSVTLFWFGAISSWLGFHIVNWKWKIESGGKSIYIDPDTNKLDFFKLSLPFFRSLLSLFTSFMILLTFYLLALSSNSYNSGIITSIFASSIVFSTIIFRVIYGQEIKPKTLIGVGLIIFSICLISMGDGL